MNLLALTDLNLELCKAIIKALVEQTVGRFVHISEIVSSETERDLIICKDLENFPREKKDGRQICFTKDGNYSYGKNDNVEEYVYVPMASLYDAITNKSGCEFEKIILQLYLEFIESHGFTLTGKTMRRKRHMIDTKT